jgi:hypothetical protein
MAVSDLDEMHEIERGRARPFAVEISILQEGKRT